MLIRHLLGILRCLSKSCVEDCCPDHIPVLGQLTSFRQLMLSAMGTQHSFFSPNSSRSNNRRRLDKGEKKPTHPLCLIYHQKGLCHSNIKTGFVYYTRSVIRVWWKKKAGFLFCFFLSVFLSWLSSYYRRWKAGLRFPNTSWCLINTSPFHYLCSYFFFLLPVFLLLRPVIYTSSVTCFYFQMLSWSWWFFHTISPWLTFLD